MDPEMLKKALSAVVSGMGKEAKAYKARKFDRKPKAVEVASAELEKPDANTDPDQDGDVHVSPVEGGLTLAGVMNKPGNSGKDIAETGSLTPEELDEILRNAH